MTSIYFLSDNELLSRVETLATNERQVTADLIRHLDEVEIRRLYAAQGYTSLFDYLTRGLQYSRASAMRRIKAMRAARKSGSVYQHLEQGSLNLSSLDLVEPYLTEENAESLINEVCGRPVEEVERIVSRFRPVDPAALKDRVKPVMLSRTPALQRELALGDGVQSSEVVTDLERFLVSFSASPEFMDKLKRAQELLFQGEKSDVALENVLGTALQLFIDKKCPKARHKRRVRRLRKKQHATLVESVLQSFAKREVVSTEEQLPANRAVEKPAVEVSQENSNKFRRGTNDNRSRYIPVAVRDEVLARDDYKCSFVGRDGVRCECSWNLEIDHIVPFARGGTHEASNLRVLCAVHNLTVAREILGDGFVQSKIEGRDIQRT